MQLCANNRHLSFRVAVCYQPTLIAWWLHSWCAARYGLILHEAASPGSSD